MKPSMVPDPDGMTGDPYKDSGKNYKLKVHPKICEVCGQKYIPAGKGQRYCQSCKAKMTQKELHARRIAKAKEQAFGPGPWSMPDVGDADACGCGGAGGEPADLPPKQWEQDSNDKVEEPEAESGYYKAVIKKEGEIVLEAKIREDMLKMIMEVIK